MRLAICVRRGVEPCEEAGLLREGMNGHVRPSRAILPTARRTPASIRMSPVMSAAIRTLTPPRPMPTRTKRSR